MSFASGSYHERYPMPKNWSARDRKQHKAKHGMKVIGKSVFVMQETSRKRDRDEQRKYKEKYQDG